MGKSGQEQSEQLIEQLTQQLDHWHLTLPALLFLQVTRPLSFIASQGLLLCEPLLGEAYHEAPIRRYADLLADRDKLDRLMSHLEGGRPRDTDPKEND
jgi:hypothetical protein